PGIAEAELDPMLEGLARMYLEEGDRRLALDIYRKAQSLGVRSSALARRIEELEAELGPAAHAPLQARAGDDMDDAAGGPPVSPEEVIGRLEGWLRNIRRLKEEASVGGA
ncbi:MAG: hypothetical protein V3V62_08645, partial [bacterium]